MKIIVFEGLDKSGKNTQARLLVDYLRAKRFKVAYAEFHNYGSPTGKLIREYLLGDYDVDDYTIELLMSADKHALQGTFKKYEESGYDYLILDRYVGSQICFARAKGHDENWIQSLHKYLIKPDLEIMFDISPKTSLSRKGQHGENDRYESNLVLLTDVRKEYLKYFAEEEGRRVFMSCDSLSISKLHSAVIELVEDSFIQVKEGVR